MPLLIDGKPVKQNDDLTNFTRTYSEFLSQSRAQFRLRPIVNVEPNSAIYVQQLEYAVVGGDDVIDQISASEFTTCCCLIVRHTGSMATGLGHFDENDTPNSVKNLTNLVVQLTQDWYKHVGVNQHELASKHHQYEVYIFGGFLDNRGISEEVCKQILETLKQLPTNLNLKLACIWNNNTHFKDNIAYPCITSLVCNIKTGDIFEANQIGDYGPLEELRFLRFSMRPPVTMSSIYEPFQKKLIISGFETNLCDDTICQLLGLNTNSFLHYWSTSPLAEAPSYVPRCKNALKFLRDNRKTMFNRDKRFEFVRVNNRWELKNAN